MSSVLLIAAMVGVFALFLGAGLRPILDDLFDRLGNSLRIELHGDREVVLVLPEGLTLDWNGKHFQKIYQQEFSVENRTRAIFTDVAVKLIFTPANPPEAGEDLHFGGLILPTAAAEGRIEPTGDPVSRMLNLSYLDADSAIEVRMFSNMEGALTFLSACGKLLTIRRSAASVSETAQRVLPGWLLALKPLMLPLAVIGIIFRKRRKTG